MGFIEIKNDEGLSAKLSSYGATLTSLKFRDRSGTPIECVLGYDTVEDYKKDEAYMGRTIGRIANRIKNGRFSFNEKDYQLPINCPPHTHHGGLKSVAFKEWEVVRHIPTSVTFRIKVREDDDGFPGDATIDVTYTINDRNQLVVEHFARCSREGVLALAHHPYFNLDGSNDVGGHKLTIAASHYLPTDSTSCPTGEILPVASTDYDLTEGKLLSSFKNDDNVIDIDHDFVLESPSKPGKRILCLSSEKSGILVGIATSYPVVHIYGGKYLDTIGRRATPYGSGKGVAIEAQYHSAALNYPEFPDVSITPEKSYCHEVIYCFGHL